MKDLDEIEKYLAVMFRSAQFSHDKEREGIHPFITISRQTGAGGHRLANAILNRMQQLKDLSVFDGWQILDKELCKTILSERNLKGSLDVLLSEEYHSHLEDYILDLLSGNAPQSAARLEAFKVIRKLATLGKVIVVGRGGACLTRDLPYGVHVRLVAGHESRTQRIMATLKATDIQARKLIAQRDRERAKLIKIYFGKDIDDPLLFDMICNTDTVPLEELADLILTLVVIKAENGGFEVTKNFHRESDSVIAQH